jgi:two-component sensor histidine kinase
MISNAIKHGMAGQRSGRVVVRGSEEDGIVTVQVLDTGIGPASEPLPSEEGGEGLGLSLIKNLIGDLGGEFSLRRESGVLPQTQHQGRMSSDQPIEYTVAEVRFPLVKHSRA